MKPTLTTDPRLTNLFGSLDARLRRRLFEVLHNPRKYWDRDHGLILSGKTWVTLWQAVIAVDPSFPKSGKVTNAQGRVVEDWRRYYRLIEGGLDRLVAAVAYAFQPDPEQIRTALAAIINFHPHDTPAQFTLPAANPYHSMRDFKSKAVREELASDASCPFISESYLYNLLGKEDARTLLARVRVLCTALGFNLDTLYEKESS